MKNLPTGRHLCPTPSFFQSLWCTNKLLNQMIASNVEASLLRVKKWVLLSEIVSKIDKVLSQTMHMQPLKYFFINPDYHQFYFGQFFRFFICFSVEQIYLVRHKLLLTFNDYKAGFFISHVFDKRYHR